MRNIDKIVIHHSLTPVSLPLEKSIISFNNSHKQRLHPTRNKYGLHIAYHHVIAGDGRSQKTRPYEDIGYHASNWEVNKTSIGICLCGNFDIEKPTEKQYIELARIINEIKTGFKVTIHGHNEFAPKTCPGKNFDFKYLYSKLNMKENEYLNILEREFPNRKPLFNAYENEAKVLTVGELKALIEIGVLRSK